MAKKTETQITQDIIAYIKSVGGDAFHVHGSALQRGGEPDISGEVPTRIGWLHLKVEVKTPTGEATARQLHRLSRYWQAGYCVGVVVSVEEFERLLEVYINWRTATSELDFGKLVRRNPEIYSGKHNNRTLAAPKPNARLRNKDH